MGRRCTLMLWHVTCMWMSEDNLLSFFLPLGALGLNSSCQACWQVPLPSEPYFWPCLINISNNQIFFYFSQQWKKHEMQTVKAGFKMKHPGYKWVKGHPIMCLGRNRKWRGWPLQLDPYWVFHLLFLGTWPRNQVPGILVIKMEREPAVCRLCGKQTYTQHKQIIQCFTQAQMSSAASDLEHIRDQALHCKSTHWDQTGTLSTVSGKTAFTQPSWY